MEFNLVNLVITVQTDSADRLQRFLATLGKEYSEVFRNIVCRWPARVCDLCSCRESCAWFLVFGQELAVDPVALKRHQKPPLPFMFSFPIINPSVENNMVLKCGLVVIGRAIHHLDVFVEAFAEFMTSDACPVRTEVIRVASRDYQGTERPLGSGSGILRSDDLVVLSAEGLLESRPWECNGLGIRLLSPLRLIEEGRPLVRFDFGRFARSVMRRVSALAYYYGEYEFDCDFKELARQAEAIIGVDDHFCQTTSANRRMAGMTGHGIFRGDFSGLMPFLVLGTYVHVGKGAAFGMGRYELIPDSSFCG